MTLVLKEATLSQLIITNEIEITSGNGNVYRGGLSLWFTRDQCCNSNKPEKKKIIWLVI